MPPSVNIYIVSRENIIVQLFKGCYTSSMGIGFSKLQGNEKVAIEFCLVDARDYAMEVNVYEHN